MAELADARVSNTLEGNLVRVRLPASAPLLAAYRQLATADAAVTAYAAYYNYHRLHGELGWRTPAERFDGTPFVDPGFEHVPSLTAVADLLADLLAA